MNTNAHINSALGYSRSSTSLPSEQDTTTTPYGVTVTTVGNTCLPFPMRPVNRKITVSGGPIWVAAAEAQVYIGSLYVIGWFDSIINTRVINIGPGVTIDIILPQGGQVANAFGTINPLGSSPQDVFGLDALYVLSPFPFVSDPSLAGHFEVSTKRLHVGIGDSVAPTGTTLASVNYGAQITNISPRLVSTAFNMAPYSSQTAYVPVPGQYPAYVINVSSIGNTINYIALRRGDIYMYITPDIVLSASSQVEGPEYTFVYLPSALGSPAFNEVLVRNPSANVASNVTVEVYGATVNSNAKAIKGQMF